MYETLKVERDAVGVVTLWLARPDKRNALSGQMIAELADFARTTGHDTATRVVILAGEGAAFCAGGDLDWMRAQIGADRTTRMAEGRALAMMLKALNELPVPLIGRVHADAFGGGVGLMCICDTVVAVTGTKFGLTETRLGLIPATIGPYVIARMGEGRARRVFMSSRLFGVEEARDLGLVARIVAPDDLDAAVDTEVTPYLSTAPGAVARAKALARALGPAIDAPVIDDTIRRLADTWEAPEALQGIEAFFARRPPPWSDRKR
jgi:methylglutaconyl-CoA hydratase